MKACPVISPQNHTVHRTPTTKSINYPPTPLLTAKCISSSGGVDQSGFGFHTRSKPDRPMRRVLPSFD